MQIILREPQPSDAPAIARLSHQLGYEMSVAATLKNLAMILESNNEIVRVATHEEKMMGWIHVFMATRLESALFCEIGGLVADDQYRGAGIGRQLIAATQPWCLSKGVTVLRVRSNTKRIEAHKFYSQVEFEELKQQRVFEKQISTS
jgi:GNAT superfamily N-acetyltransferase